MSVCRWPTAKWSPCWARPVPASRRCCAIWPVSSRATRPRSVTVNGQLIQRRGKLSRQVRGARASIGFVFQQFNLVGRLPVITNVLTGMLPRVPLWRSLTRWFRRDEVRAGLDALAQVGIDDYAFQRASTLSGGQQQRAAIARTLVQNARVILADEPIASLDPESRAA